VEVRDRRPLCDYVVEIELQLLDDFPARAGQFLTFIREDGLARPYSIANIPALDGFVSLHVGRVAGGEMSNWIHDELRPGDQATVRGPAGECFYLADEPDRPLILAGTGTGLAPLYAVLRDALQHDHRGPIHLFHGARRADGLYLDARLRELADQLEQFSYSASVLEGDAPGETVATPLDELLFGTYPSLKEQRLYLCGAPELVHAIKRKAFLAGASLHRIASDAFVMGS
jgi:NAD(P)H-flavin reductase